MAATALSMDLWLCGPKEKHFTAVVDGSSVVSTTTIGGKAKETTRAYASPAEAEAEREKIERKKLREGWVHRNDAADIGDICFVAYAGSGGGGAVVDLDRNGDRVVRVTCNSQLTSHRIDVVDVQDGRFTTLVDGATASQAFVHRALLDARGGLYYTLNDEVWHQAPSSAGDRPPPRKISGFFAGAVGNQFNPHVVRPAFDAARRRLMLFDAGLRVRVVDVERDERSLCTIDTGTGASGRSTVEVRAAALSASGELLALYRPSRVLIYGHDDARDDDTHVIDVHAVDGGALLHRIAVPVEERVAVVAFDAEDRGLVVAYDNFGSGGVVVGLGFDGAEQWRLPSVRGREYAYACAVSPDGTMLAVGRTQPQLYATPTKAPLPLASVRAYRVQDLRFSADSRRLAVATDLVTTVFRVA